MHERKYKKINRQLSKRTSKDSVDITNAIRKTYKIDKEIETKKNECKRMTKYR